MTVPRDVSVAAGAIIGAIAFAQSMGWDALDPTRLDWVFVGGLDPTRAFLGWHMFRNGPWAMPLGATPAYAYPVGSSVALTDSIPALALLFKPFTAILPSYFQYEGLWLLLCFALQGVFGVLLLRTRTESRWLQFLGAALLVMSPLLLHRATAQPALTAHWLVLASLWLYFKPKGTLVASVLQWLLIVCIAAAIHLYLAVMVLALAAASLARDALHQPERISTVALVPGALLVAAAASVWWITGQFVVGEASNFDVSEFGSASMNVLSPLMPLDTSLLFGRGPFAMADPAQNEGYAYFGAGGWLMLVVAAILMKPRTSTSARTSLVEIVPLLVALVVLTALALGPRVTVGARTILEYDASWWGPMSIFRASGRMFWPVYYALLFAALVRVATRMPPRVATALVVVAVALQAVDLSAAYRQSHSNHAVRMPAMPFSNSFWFTAAPHYQHVVMHPTNMCSTRRDTAIDYRFLMLHAGRTGATVNSGYAGRDIQKLLEYCTTFADDIKAGRVADDQLWVVLPRFAPDLMIASANPLICAIVDGHAACVTQASYLRWQGEFDIVRRNFVPEQDLRNFRQSLERDYRDRMGRPSTSPPATSDIRLRALTDYLALRAYGCAHDEAVGKAVAEFKKTAFVRACSRQRLAPRAVPPESESFDFRKTLDAVLRETMPGLSEPTHVDDVGEVVWMRGYVEHRLAGRNHRDASDAVLARIRTIAP